MREMEGREGEVMREGAKEEGSEGKREEEERREERNF